MTSSTSRRAEYKILEEALSKQKAEKEQLERKAVEIQARIRQLDSDILSTKSRWTMLAPVNMLPDDVMIDILHIAYLHDFPHCRTDDGLCHTNSPIAFSQVCRRWRALALGMPALWTCIHVTPHQTKGYQAMAALYLERSRKRPVSVTFQAHLEPSELFPAFKPGWQHSAWPRYRASWEVLLAQSHRWKRCAVYTTFSIMSSHITQSLRGRILPRLQYFAHSLSLEGTQSNGVRFFAPNLGRMDLINVSPGHPKTDAFTRLTELKLSECPSVRELQNVLSQTHLLQQLTLKDIQLYHGFFGWTGDRRIYLPHLRSLILSGYHEHDFGTSAISEIFRCAPHLVELVLWDADIVGSELKLGTLSIPQSLRILRYGDFWMDSREITPSIPALFPGLEELHFNCEVAVEVLHTMIELHESSGVVPLPNLRTLVFPGHVVHFEDPLGAFLKHRAKIGHPIHTVRLSKYAWRNLHRRSRTLLAKHASQIITHSGKDDGVQWDWIDCDWNGELNVPVYMPWDGSFDWWDQF